MEEKRKRGRRDGGINGGCLGIMFSGYKIESCCLVAHVLLFCDTMVCSPPGSSVRVIHQARMLEWAAISSLGGSSWPRDRTPVSCTGRRILYRRAPSEAQWVRVTPTWGRLTPDARFRQFCESHRNELSVHVTF